MSASDNHRMASRFYSRHYYGRSSVESLKRRGTRIMEVKPYRSNEVAILTDIS